MKNYLVARRTKALLIFYPKRIGEDLPHAVYGVVLAEGGFTPAVVPVVGATICLSGLIGMPRPSEIGMMRLISWPLARAIALGGMEGFGFIFDEQEELQGGFGLLVGLR